MQARGKAIELKLDNIEFVMADVEEHEFAAASFDAIMAASAVPYFQNYESTFKTFCKWLKADGKLVFNTPKVGPCVMRGHACKS